MSFVHGQQKTGPQRNGFRCGPVIRRQYTGTRARACSMRATHSRCAIQHTSLEGLLACASGTRFPHAASGCGPLTDPAPSDRRAARPTHACAAFPGFPSPVTGFRRRACGIPRLQRRAPPRIRTGFPCSSRRAERIARAKPPGRKGSSGIVRQMLIRDGTAHFSGLSTRFHHKLG